MPLRSVPHRLLLACALAAALVAACNDRRGLHRIHSAPDAQGLADGRPDAGASDTTGEADATVAIPEGAVAFEHGRTRLLLRHDPFVLELHDTTAGLVTRSAAWDGPEDAAFAPIAFARALRHDPRAFLDPKLPANGGRGAGLVWFVPREVLDVAQGPSFVRVAMSSRPAAPGGPWQAGPEVILTLEPSAGTGNGVALTVEVAESNEPTERLVHHTMSLEAGTDEATGQPLAEGFYGLGQQFDRLDHRGLVRELQIQAQGDSESATNEVHVPVSFFMSTRGYGLFVDNRYPAAVDFAAARHDVVRTNFQASSITYHFFVDPDPARLVETYTDVTGKPAQVPFWALAPQWWRNENKSDEELLDDAQRARDLDMPSTLVWIDRPWSSYYHNWTFNPAQFPDPAAMFQRLHDLGYRVLMHHSPQINLPGTGHLGAEEDNSEGLYELYRSRGWLVQTPQGNPFVMPWGGGSGAFVDFSHPGATEHVQGLITRVTALGAVGTKMDWDEYLQPNVGSRRLFLEFANGESNLTMKTWYSALYHKAIIEAFERQLGEPGFHVSRSGMARDQVWNTCIWPGDLDNDFSEHTRGPSEGQQAWNVGGMPAAIVASQSLGMSGYPCFGSDIGGYREGLPTEEVLLRWMAFGVFNPVMQIGGGGASHMPWTADSTYSPAALNITRELLKLRMALFPYIFEQLQKSRRTGRPLVQSLWIAFPKEPEARRRERDFLFGPDLLVAPVFTPNTTTREVWLPPGQWVDLWSGERLEGGQILTRPAPIDRIPVFLRAGAILPLAPEGVHTLLPASAQGVTSYQDVPGRRVLLVPGPAASTSTLETFDGLVLRLERPAPASGSGVMGPPALVHVAFSQGELATGLDERLQRPAGAVSLEIATHGVLPGQPMRVDYASNLEPPVPLAQGDTRTCLSCWATSPTSGRLIVRVPHDGTLTLY